MNKTVLIGALTKDSELRYSQNNKPICSFDIAVNEGFGDNKTTDYFKIKLFGGEKLSSYLVKGAKVAICGKLKNNNYEDKNGIKHYGMEIIADNFGGVELLGSKGTNSSNSSGQSFSSGNFEEDLQPMQDDSMPFN